MGVDIKISGENLLPWSHMEDWVDGASAAPTEHTLSGAGASVAREATTIKFGTYSAAVTRAGADTTLYYDLPAYADYQGRKVTFGCWVNVGTASRARIAISDGVGSTNSSYHTGGGDWEFLSVTHDVDGSATRLRVEMHVNTGNVTAYFDGGILVDGPDTITDISSYVEGWRPIKNYSGQIFKVARRDESKVPQLKLESQRINIKGTITGTSADNARTNFDSLLKAINAHRIKPNEDREMKDLYLYSDRLIKVFLERFDNDYLAASTNIRFGMSFIAPLAFHQAVNKTRKQQSLSGTTTFTVTHAGTAFSRPVISITNDGSNITSLTVENLTKGQTFNYSGSLATGNDLVVDTDLLTVENNDVGDIANFTGDTDMILLPGDNEFKVTGVVVGTAKVDWFDRWY